MIKIAMLIYPGMNPFHFAVPYTAFHDAAEAGLFELKMVTADGQPIAGQMVQPPIDGGLALFEQCDVIVVPGWQDETVVPQQTVLDAFQTASARGACLVGLCFGTYALAYAGVLDGRRAATHWKGEADFSRRFPRVKLDVNSIYVEDGNIITSAGTAAALDCCLHIIRKFYGAGAANRAARILVVPPQREGGQAQFIERPVSQSSQDRKINELTDYLRTRLHLPHSVDSAAEYAAMSRSTFTRHFRKATGETFCVWLNRERLQYSLQLLEHTSWPVARIAEQSGFENIVSFRRQFYRYYQVNPSNWRKMFGAAGEPNAGCRLKNKGLRLFFRRHLLCFIRPVGTMID